MKLVIVTAVEEYHKTVLRLFNEAGIDSFSSSSIDGHKNQALISMKSWFPSVKGGNESHLYFSFTRPEAIQILLKKVKELNATLESNNPIKAIVLPIEDYV